MEPSILKQGSYLVITIESNLIDANLQQLCNITLTKVSKFHINGVILDLSTQEIMDSYSVRTFTNLAEMLRLKGAETVIVGIRPEVALSMVQLGLGSKLKNVSVALDLDEGLAHLNQLNKEKKG